MKKILCLMAMAMMLFSSCLKDYQEPESITSLREAKAALITADAAFKAAETALKQAEVEYQNAKTAEQILINELQALTNEAQAIENDKARVDLEIKKLELAMAQAENEVELARLESEKAKWAAEKAKYEKQLMQYQQEVEQMIENHKIEMLELLELVAKAEADYEEALKLLEQSKLHLTEDQQAIVDNYTAALKALRYGGSYVDMAGKTVTLAKSLSDLRQSLIKANANLQNAQFNWNHAERIAMAELDSVIAQAEINEAKQALADFQEFAEDQDIKSWEAKAKEIEGVQRNLVDSMLIMSEKGDALNAQLEDIDDQLAAIDREAKAIANNLAGFDDAPYADPENPEYNIVESKKYVIEQELVALKKYLDAVMMADSEIKRVFEVNVPSVVGLREWIISSINRVLPSDLEVQIDPVTKKYALEGDVVRVELPLFGYDINTPAVYESANGILSSYRSLKSAMASYCRTEVDHIEFLDWYHANKNNYDQRRIRFNIARGKWDELATAVTKAVADYSMGSTFDAQNDLYNAWLDYNEIDSPTPLDTQEYLDAYAEYIKLRQPLDGRVRTFYLDSEGEYVDILDYLKVAFYGTIIDEYDLTPIRNESKLTLSSGYTTLYGTDLYLDEDFDQKGILPRWEYLSKAIWGEQYQRVATDTYLDGDLEYAYDWTYIDGYVAFAYYNVGDKADKLLELGYDIRFGSNLNSTVTTITNANRQEAVFFLIYNDGLKGLWEDVIFNDAYSKQNSVLENNQTVIAELIEELDAQIEKYTEEFESKEADIEEYNETVEEINEKIEDVIEEYNLFVEENKEPLLEQRTALAKDIYDYNVEFAKFYARAQSIQALYEYYLDLIDVYYALFAESLDPFSNTSDLMKCINEIVNDYKEEIIELTEDLNDCIKVLQELRRGTDGNSVAYQMELERLQGEVEKIEAEIEDRLEKIDYYETLLGETLEIFMNSEEA